MRQDVIIIYTDGRVIMNVIGFDLIDRESTSKFYLIPEKGQGTLSAVLVLLGQPTESSHNL